MRWALYESNLKIAVLPGEYNCRTQLARVLYQSVKLFHTTMVNYDRQNAILNQYAEPRISFYFSYPGAKHQSKYHILIHENRLRQFKWLPRSNGAYGTASHALVDECMD